MLNDVGAQCKSKVGKSPKPIDSFDLCSSAAHNATALSQVSCRLPAGFGLKPAQGLEGQGR
jgi:hypothetical protein